MKSTGRGKSGRVLPYRIDGARGVKRRAGAIEPPPSRGYAKDMDELDRLIEDEADYRRRRDAEEAEAYRLEQERLAALPPEERLAALLQKMAEFQAELNDLLPRLAAVDPDAWEDRPTSE